ncbi:MAG: hypothetical protein ACI87E_001247 [Mariniblastus sp.]|jgi:hypothetical protein
MRFLDLDHINRNCMLRLGQAAVALLGLSLLVLIYVQPSWSTEKGGSIASTVGMIRPVAFVPATQITESNERLGIEDLSQGQPNDLKKQFKNRVIPFVKKYCWDCHEGGDGEGDIDLAQFANHTEAIEELEVWSRVLEQVERGDMPPEDSNQPTRREVEYLRGYVLKSIETAERLKAPLGGMRRLNRVEYENTIRDLFRLTRGCFNNPAKIVQTQDYFQPATGRMPRYVLAVSHFFNSHHRYSDLPGVSTLPVDPPVEHGFANDQGALSLSPLLLENYLEISAGLMNNAEFSQISGLWEAMFVAEDSASPKELIEQGHEKITMFLPRAFRRNVRDTELRRYQDLFQDELLGLGTTAAGYTESMKTTVSAILVSPSFLFRDEFTPVNSGDASRRQTELEQNYAMANRLSYFLWASMPDDELFQAAKERRLTNPLDLERQVSRMMEDRKIKSLATEFGMQWLKVHKAASAIPDRERFPEYYQEKIIPPPAVSMMIEQLLFFESVMVENRSIEEFVSSDFGFLNRQLMNWYGVDPKAVLGYTPPIGDFEDFFRIKWPNGHRGGVLSSGAMLISTSTTTRTSPVYRGAWILDVVFNAPPPPAPANIPSLEQAEDGLHSQLNVRDKLAKHREDPACASCHDRIDPMGFAFEMFDAVGRWRGKYENGDPIDSSGEINGESFRGSAVFKNVILREKSRFVRAFVEHTMKYALGRQLHYSDAPEIRRISELVIKQNCRFRSVIKQIVLSEMFRRFDEQ